MRYSLPHPNPGLALGDVEVLPFEGAEHIAQYAAFAASVANNYSTPAAISGIGAKLGQFATEHRSVRIVSAPLLGAGAGGLRSEDVVMSLHSGFQDCAPEDARLFMFVLHKEVFDRLRRLLERDGSAMKPVHRRVFISHTSKSDEQAKWVEELAVFLIDHGLQARLDRFHLRRGMDLHQWMCNELTMADKVIIVCDEDYKLRAEGRIGGVGWETMVIQGDMAALPPDSTKYQVIVRSATIDDGLPMFLKTKYVFHTGPAADFSSIGEELVRELKDLAINPRLRATEFVV